MNPKFAVTVTEMRDAGTKNWLLNHPAFTGSVYGKSLKSQPLGFIDVGARGGVSSIVEPIAAATAVLGFEPDVSESQSLRDGHASAPKWHTFEISSKAVAGSSGQRKFYETARGVNSSLLRPSESFAKRYQSPGFAIKNISNCLTDTLDNIIFGCQENSPHFGEFLKLDVQGAELEVLQGAERLLSERTVGVVAEVCFCELYESQPLFGDVAAFMKEKGFGFYGFHEMSHRASHLRHLITQQSPKWSQRLLHADAVFFRDDVFIRHEVDGGLRSRAVLFCVAILLGHYDTAYEILVSEMTVESRERSAVEALLEELAVQA